jgi:hypothetical protein
MGQPLAVYSDMAFDARYFLAAVVPFFRRRIGVFHALRINNDETGFLVATIAAPDLANRFFLTPLKDALAALVGDFAPLAEIRVASAPFGKFLR